MAGQQEGRLAEAIIADGGTIWAGQSERPLQEVVDSLGLGAVHRGLLPVARTRRRA
jgi:hypothetical protein